jgi:hypothetical protein
MDTHTALWGVALTAAVLGAPLYVVLWTAGVGLVALADVLRQEFRRVGP